MATAKKELVSMLALYLHSRSGHLNVIDGVAGHRSGRNPHGSFDGRRLAGVATGQTGVGVAR